MILNKLCLLYMVCQAAKHGDPRQYDNIKQKCVSLEDLAAKFKLRTQDCINRITSLEAMGRLSGVMDDRGKYVYISLEEMQAVADYIKREGRVSISHLASKSNQFIDLEPKPEIVEDLSIAEEEISVA